MINSIVWYTENHEGLHINRVRLNYITDRIGRGEHRFFLI